MEFTMKIDVLQTDLKGLGCDMSDVIAFFFSASPLKAQVQRLLKQTEHMKKRYSPDRITAPPAGKLNLKLVGGHITRM